MPDDRIVSIVESIPADLLIKFIDLLDGTHAQVRATRLVSEDAPVTVDEITGNLTTISTLHQQIHAEAAFTSSFVNVALGNNNHIVVLLRNPAGSGKVAHLTFLAAAGGDARIQVVLGMNVTDDGTALTRRNRVLGSAQVAVCETFHTPTLAGGAARLDAILPGGTGGNAVGGSSGQRLEWNVPPGYDLIVDSQNISGNAKVAGLGFEWYEESL